MTLPDIGGPLEASRPDQAAAESARLAVRLSTAYVLRSLHLAATFLNGDVLPTIVFQAIALANVAHLDRSPIEGARYRAIADSLADDLRRPVSVLAIADSLGLSYETTRRHVKKLQASGHCLKVPGGLIVPGRVLEGPAQSEMLLSNFANLRRLFRALKAAGVNLD